MKTIIVATDFSEASGSALKTAIKLAETLTARILLVFVQNTTDLRYALQQEIPIHYRNSTELKASMGKIINKKFQSFVRKFGRNDIQLQTLILRGTPWQEISKLARKRKADFVVTGSRGLSSIKTFFVGSTTQNLLRICSCPVIVTHERKRISKKKVAA